MARRSNTQGIFSLHNVVSGRARALRARPTPRRRTYQFERLEERLAMDGDNSLAVDVLAADDSATIVAASTVVTANSVAAVDDLPATFQSTAEFEAWLVEAAVAKWSHLFGKSTYGPDAYLWSDIAISPIVLRAAPGQMMAFDTSMSLASTNSFTNVQVEGVDEADLVETDGEFLYILSGKELMIVRAGIGDELELMSRIELDGQPAGMYLDGDRLAIVSTSGGILNTVDSRFILFAADYAKYSYEPATATVTVLDVSDRSAPTLVQKSQMDGQLVASRVVDGQLRLVLSNSLHFPPPLARPIEGGAAVRVTNPILARPFVPVRIGGARLMMIDAMDYAYWEPPAATHVYETQDEYTARIGSELLDSASPGVRTFVLEGEVVSERSLVEVNDIHRPERLGSRYLTTIATLDLSANEAGPADTRSVLTESVPQIYATAESVYLFDTLSVNYTTDHYTGPVTAIRKFDFDAATHEVKFSARGHVEGTLLNQFAADEYDGHLRVVTTPDWGTFGQSVTVLKQIGRRLEIVGEVSEIAPTEQVYSVRFMGERAFLVTFRQVDPLFALDLSDPADPKIMGELKVPGYSDYLQPIDENHLLAIGRGADEATGFFQELQVSIFNIADLTDPQLVHRYSFDGGRAIETPATGDRWQRGDGDHHAVSYFADAGVFALPILNNGESGWWWDGDDTNSQLEAGQGGLQVLQIDVAAGFTPTGLIQHDMLVERSVRIGEHLFAISSGMVTAHELSDPSIQVGQLNLPSGDASFNRLALFVAPPTVEFALTEWTAAETSAAEVALPIVGVDRLTVARSVAAEGGRQVARSATHSATHSTGQSRVSDLLSLSLRRSAERMWGVDVEKLAADEVLAEMQDAGRGHDDLAQGLAPELAQSLAAF